MSALKKPRVITEAEYLAMAEASPVKLEFIGGVVYAKDAPYGEVLDGVVYAMAGAHPNHTRIPKNFDRAAVAPLDARGCQGFDSDQQVRINDLGEYVYPDSTYVCGTPEFDGIALLNPTLIVEVLSPSTEKRDYREKLPLYREIPSIEQILLIDSTEPYVESYVRHGDLWAVEQARGLGAAIPVLGHPVRLLDVYRFIDFEERGAEGKNDS